MVESSSMRWPAGFLWGTGASSTQCEGASPASDWWDWERAGRAPLSGDGNGFATHFAEDFRILADLGLRHHRLSIEWARIEPEPGVRDANAIAHYRDVLQAARAAGVVPWICLHHFTLPRWFAERGAFLVERNRTEAWRRHVDFMAETFGGLAGGWQPVNEMNFYAHLSYKGGGFPPGHDDREESAAVSEAIHLATFEAAARVRQTGAPVSSIFALTGLVALDDEPATADRLAQMRASYYRPGIDLFREGVLRIPGRAPVERPDLAGCFDLIGFSYYLTFGVRAGNPVLHPEGAAMSPLGYAIWADGLGLVLDDLRADLPGVPLLVAEYGVGTDDDGFRARYLERGLEVTQAALARGIDVRGFFHWTAVDNYEWMHGYDVKFGILDRDRNVRPSAEVLRREAQRG
jgi:beta-glucosidase